MTPHEFNQEVERRGYSVSEFSVQPCRDLGLSWANEIKIRIARTRQDGNGRMVRTEITVTGPSLDEILQELPDAKGKCDDHG